MTDLQKLLDEATKGPWRACKNGDCSCGIVWSKPHDHPVATAQGPEWGDEWFDASPTKDDPTATKRIFLPYGSFPESEFHANARLIALAPQLAAALIKAREGLAIALDDLDEWVGCKDSLEKAGFNMDDTADRAKLARATLAEIDALMEGNDG